MSMTRAVVACPVCAKQIVGDPLHRYTVDEAAAQFCPPSRDADRFRRLRNVIRRLWQGDASEVYVCDGCGFGFGWPFVGGDEEYYSILHEQAGYPRNRWEYGLARSRILEDFPEGGSILDVGTGAGAFLRSFPASWRVSALEGSDVTRHGLRKQGIECFGSIDEATAQKAESFQAVTMFQVLEHVAEFEPLLSGVRGLLAPGGLIAVSVPLASAMFVQERLTGCRDMTPNHINKWSPESLAMALRAAGFETEKALLEPANVYAALNRAGLMTRAQAARSPWSLGGLTYRVRERRLRMALLAGISGLNLLGSVLNWSQLIAGSSFLMVGRKPVPLR